jgi:hypothetical protein
MVIYSTLLLAILALLAMAIDITAFFMLVRVIMLWKEIAWLKPFDDTGKNLVYRYSEMIDRSWYRVMKRHLATKGKLLVGLVALELARLLVTGTANLL